MVTLIAIIVLGTVGLIYWRWSRRPKFVTSPFADIPVQKTKVGDWEIRFHKSGQGPYLLLLHGLGANLFCWRWLLPLLTHKFTVVMLDLPGFGGSSKLPGAHYGLDEQTERLRDFCDQLKIKKTYIVGNSMGGNIALWFASVYPDRCLGCAVIAPATSSKLVPLSTKPWLWLAHPISYVVGRQAMRWAHRRTVSVKERVDDQRVEETYLTYGRNREAVRSFLAATESIRDPRLAKRLRELQIKVLILWGSEDRLVPRKVIDDLEAALAASESHVHIGGGHHLQEDSPEWVAGKIDTFFSTRPD
ncbi:MAG: alpha/beta fold hydrolase [Bdellovibrionales bacterium]